MSIKLENNEHNSLVKIIVDAGFIDGWALNATKLVLWEHDENPPAPLTRPE